MNNNFENRRQVNNTPEEVPELDAMNDMHYFDRVDTNQEKATSGLVSKIKAGVVGGLAGFGALVGAPGAVEGQNNLSHEELRAMQVRDSMRREIKHDWKPYEFSYQRGQYDKLIDFLDKFPESDEVETFVTNKIKSAGGPDGIEDLRAYLQEEVEKEKIQDSLDHIKSEEQRLVLEAQSEENQKKRKVLDQNDILIQRDEASIRIQDSTEAIRNRNTQHNFWNTVAMGPNGTHIEAKRVIVEAKNIIGKEASVEGENLNSPYGEIISIEVVNTLNRDEALKKHEEYLSMLSPEMRKRIELEEKEKGPHLEYKKFNPEKIVAVYVDKKDFSSEDLGKKVLIDGNIIFGSVASFVPFDNGVYVILRLTQKEDELKMEVE